MRQTALKFAAAGFFALAIIGMCRGVSPLTCGLALAGAAVIFVLTLATARVLLNVIVDSMMDSMARRKK